MWEYIAWMCVPLCQVSPYSPPPLMFATARMPPRCLTYSRYATLATDRHNQCSSSRSYVENKHESFHRLDETAERFVLRAEDRWADAGSPPKPPFESLVSSVHVVAREEKVRSLLTCSMVVWKPQSPHSHKGTPGERHPSWGPWRELRTWGSWFHLYLDKIPTNAREKNRWGHTQFTKMLSNMSCVLSHVRFWETWIVFQICSRVRWNDKNNL